MMKTHSAPAARPSATRTRISGPYHGPVPNLRHVTTGELCQQDNSRLMDVIVLKLNSLDATKFVERQVIAKVRVLLELLRDSLTGRYSQLSVVAFAEILLVMDYFIEVCDLIPDTWPRGFEDDLRKLDQVWRDNRAEIASYLEHRG